MMKRNENSQLSRNAIKQIFNLRKDQIEVDFILQVTAIKKKTETKNNKNYDLYQATLSDGEYKYKGFLIFKNDSASVCQEFDLIRIFNVNQTKLNSLNERVFIIKKYDLVEKSTNIIGDPKMLLDPESKEKFSSHNADQDSENNVNINNYNPNVNSTNREQNQNNMNSHINIRPNNTYEQNLKISANKNYDHERKKKSFYQPLSTLTTFSKDILIYVKCTKKCEMKTFNNSRGGGCLFSFYLLDSEGSEMPVTCFNKACEKFFPLIQEGLCYEINGGYIKVNDKKFTTVKSEYKLIIDENTRIEEERDDGSIGELPFDFIQISDLSKLPPFHIVDIFGYVININEPSTIKTRNGEQTMRRVTLVDMSCYEVDLTLWKQFCNLEITKGMVLCVRSVKIGEYNGRSLSSVEDTKILIDPPEAHTTELKLFCQNYQETWKKFPSAGLGNSDSNSSTQIQTIKEVLSILDNNSNPDDKLPLSKIKATICSFLHSDKNYYPGCPEKTCKKKLTQETYNWQCSNCSKIIDNPTYYYTLSLRIRDISSEHWVDIFGETGQKLLNVSCEDYKDLIQNKDEQKLREISNRLEFQSFFFLAKPKLNTYQNISKKKINIFKIEPIDVNLESKRLLRNIQSVLFEKYNN